MLTEANVARTEKAEKDTVRHPSTSSGCGALLIDRRKKETGQCPVSTSSLRGR